MTQQLVLINFRFAFKQFFTMRKSFGLNLNAYCGHSFSDTEREREGDKEGVENEKALDIE